MEIPIERFHEEPEIQKVFDKWSDIPHQVGGMFVLKDKAKASLLDPLERFHIYVETGTEGSDFRQKFMIRDIHITAEDEEGKGKFEWVAIGITPMIGDVTPERIAMKRENLDEKLETERRRVQKNMEKRSLKERQVSEEDEQVFQDRGEALENRVQSRPSKYRPATWEDLRDPKVRKIRSPEGPW